MKITASTVTNIVLSVVLLSSLFYVGVTSSIAVYDPYADYDQDGDVDIFDVVPMADAYGTTGDSTRNVTVTNFPTMPEPKTVVVCENYTFTSIGVGLTPIGGTSIAKHRYVSIFVKYYSSSGADFDLHCYPCCHNITVNPQVIHLQNNFGWFTTGLLGFAAQAPYLSLEVYSYGAGSFNLTIVLYCYN